MRLAVRLSLRIWLRLLRCIESATHRWLARAYLLENLEREPRETKGSRRTEETAVRLRAETWVRPEDTEMLEDMQLATKRMTTRLTDRLSQTR